MRASFEKVSLEKFAELLARFPFSRSIDAVHLHHTWHPNHAEFKGQASIIGMWRYHTEHNGWSDIAQHITIDPNGEIWLGRNWNTPPASASGFNGNYHSGPFMIEMIGDFDVGADKFEGRQRAAATTVVAMVQQCFGLPPQSLKFHNMMSGKTCPGSNIDYGRTLDEVARQRVALGDRGRALPAGAAPFHRDAVATGFNIARTIEDMNSHAVTELSDFEAGADACTHHEHRHDSHAAAAPLARQARATEIDLRPHLVNLSMGELSGSGAWTTTRADVDAIFNLHLPRALDSARAAGRPLRLMFQAHGGLDDEATGLAIARKSVAWWLDNGIYPVYFAWETGLFESIGQLLRRAKSGKRDLADYTSDPLIQEAVRLLGAPKIWGVMKQNAQAASAPDTLGISRQAQPGREGGAYYVAQQLAAFCKRHGEAVELHAVGHSAGSIFHSWFIPCALALGAPQFRSLHLMAPAVRIDVFKEKLAPLIGDRSGIGELTVYTMNDGLENDDNCAEIYRKSLLYLIFNALEPQRKTALLGLEENLRADSDLSRMFGLTGGPATAEVIWSKTDAVKGRSASTADSHGGFDDDSPTMSSIARRILNKDDHEAIVEYPSAGDGGRAMAWGEVAFAAAPAATAPGPQRSGSSGGIRLRDKTGARRALCVGINDYASRPLSGCLADVASWSGVLAQAGFSVTCLLDRQATRANIIAQLEGMIADSRKGDVIVFQYSGHGTQLPDHDGDEEDGTDESLVPYDYETGAYLLDDDLGKIYARVPEGVNLTCFMDCCHSGDNARLFMADVDERPRFLPATAEMVEANRRYRESAMGAGARALASAAAPKPTFEVSFAACSPTESAWESRNQGEFTVRATAILERGFAGVTNGAFIEKVRADFGDAARQHVQLDTGYRGLTVHKRLLLQPLTGAPAEDLKQAAVQRDDPSTAADVGQVVELLRSIKQLLQQGQLQLPRMKEKARPNGTVQAPAPQSVQSSPQQNR